uniref:Uncharacterized protein n=1 Tax=Oryza meridionalis TaxID=40149 RepID=A0A0E0FEE1_9ORYZ
MADRRGPLGEAVRGPEGYDVAPRGLGAKRYEGPRGTTWHPEASGRNGTRARGVRRGTPRPRGETCEGPRGTTWHPEAPWPLPRSAGYGSRTRL